VAAGDWGIAQRHQTRTSGLPGVGTRLYLQVVSAFYNSSIRG